MEEAQEQSDGEVELAGFSDRVVAFSVDYALFAAGYFVSLKLLFPAYPVLLNPHGMKWSLLWIALFIVYHAALSMDGRATLGKQLLGIRVVNLDGEPVGLGAAILRSASYLLSSVLCAGFLWMLFTSARQTWHDLIGGTVVIRLRPETAKRKTLVRAGAAACIFAFAGVWFWNFIIGEYYYRTMTVAYAHVGVKEIDVLQRRYYDRNGRFATNILTLATLSGDPKAFLRDMWRLYDREAGIKFYAKGKTYRMVAQARDADKTKVDIIGPLKPIE